MKFLIGAIFTIFAVTLSQVQVQPPHSQTSKPRHQLSTREYGLERVAVYPTAYVQVTLQISNKKGAPLVIPVFEGNKLSGMHCFLEQKTGSPPQWQRAVVRDPDVVGDVIFPDRRVVLKPGESAVLSYGFNPTDFRLPDGRPLRYPGKVRVTVLASLDEKWIGLPGMEFQISSEEFDIPPPPKTWGTPTAKRKTRD